jgi:hypothetical protein
MNPVRSSLYKNLEFKQKFINKKVLNAMKSMQTSNRVNKKISLYALAVIVSTFFASPALIFAQGRGGGTTTPPLIDDKDDIIVIAEDIAQWVYRLFFVIAVLYILLAAYQYLTARDDTATVKKAQTSLKNAVIAIIIALVSTGLSLLIKSFL